MAKKKLKKVSVIVRGKVLSDHHYEGLCLGSLVGFVIGVVVMWVFVFL